MKCLLFSTKSYEKEILEKQNDKTIIYEFTEKELNLENVHLCNHLSTISISVGDQVDKELIDALKKLGIKNIITRSAGTDHINEMECKKAGIHVYNIPEYGPESIAEHALLLCLCMLRKFKKIQVQIACGDFRLDDLIGETIHGKTVAVLGTGRIGSRFSRAIMAMGGNLIGYDTLINQDLVRDNILRYTNLDEIVRNADIISIHLPLTNQTKYLIDEIFLNRLEKKPWVINTARGALVKTEAMLQALSDGKVRGYATDVYENEAGLFHESNIEFQHKDPLFSRLLAHEKVLVTPHLAFATKSSLDNMMKQMTNMLARIGNKDVSKIKL
jgi:D-lactate dehydrogenase